MSQPTPTPIFYEKGQTVIIDNSSGNTEHREITFEVLNGYQLLGEKVISELSAAAKFKTEIGTANNFENCRF